MKKNHPKQTSYTFLKNSMDQPRVDITKNVLYSDSLISCILEKKKNYTHPLKDSYIFHDRIDASFFSSSSERFLYRSRAYWRFLSFSSLERFWYLSRAFF